MRRIAMPAALVFAGALALSGCAAGDGGDTAEPADDICSTIATQMRDISNGVQNTLASSTTVDEIEAYLDDAQARIDAAVEEAGENEELVAAVEEFKAELESASEYAGELTEGPSEDDPEETVVEQDPEAMAERQAAVMEAAAEVRSACADDDD